MVEARGTDARTAAAAANTARATIWVAEPKGASQSPVIRPEAAMPANQTTATPAAARQGVTNVARASVVTARARAGRSQATATSPLSNSATDPISPIGTATASTAMVRNRSSRSPDSGAAAATSWAGSTTGP